MIVKPEQPKLIVNISKLPKKNKIRERFRF